MKILEKIILHVPFNSCIHHIKQTIQTLENSIPFVNVFKNMHILEEHWRELENIIQIEDVDIREKNFSFKEILDQSFLEFHEQVAEIDERSTQEYQIQKKINELEYNWRNLPIKCKTYKPEVHLLSRFIKKLTPSLMKTFCITTQI